MKTSYPSMPRARTFVGLGLVLFVGCFSQMPEPEDAGALWFPSTATQVMEVTACSPTSPCPTNQVCCQGSCQTGVCCPGAVNASGQVCSGYQYQACQKSEECGLGRVCCQGACVVGDCCSNSECGQYVCRSNQCSACTFKTDCGSGNCLSGACTDAECVYSTDCKQGKACLNGYCSACTRHADCGTGQVCCQGTCLSGNCCTSAECQSGEVCNTSGFCGACSSKFQCERGQTCCNGACVNGTCCSDAECGLGKKCTGFSCQGCTPTSPCARGQVCCNGGCQTGNCCSPTGKASASADCGGLVCLGSVCSACTKDQQCGTNSKCCNGACYPGLECCTSQDCSSGQACVGGKCAVCQKNEDCGSLACCDDDGPGPATAKCQAFCAITHVYNTQATFDEGQYDGTTTRGSNLDSACDAGVMCWAGTAKTVTTPFLWVPRTSTGKVQKYSTETGALWGSYDENVDGGWPTKPGAAPGVFPSRIAVNPFDATVWVSDRGYTNGTYARSGVAHLGFDGKIKCFAPVAGGASAVAVDANGHAWVGSWANRTMTQFSGTELDISPSSPPRCKTLRTVDVQLSPNDASVDDKNILWISSNERTVSVVDANTGKWGGKIDVGCIAQSIAVDKDEVWVGCAASQNVSRTRKTTRVSQVLSLPGRPRALHASNDGFVYVASDLNLVFKVNRANNVVTSMTVSGLSNIQALSMDSASRLWLADANGSVLRMKSDGSAQVKFGGSTTQDDLGDMTGQKVIDMGLAPGLWTVVYDSNYLVSPQSRWLRVNMDATLPPNSRVEVRVKVATTQAALTSTPYWNGKLPEYTYRPLENGVVRLDDVGLPRGRFIQIEVKLIAGVACP